MRPSSQPCASFAIAVALLLATAGPVQALIDADADGFPEAGDCDDGNAQVWATPGEALQVRFAADKVTLSWAPPAGPGGVASSVRYDTLRSTSPSNFASVPPSGCFDPEGLTAASTDASIPPPGTAFFYLVRAKNDCGDATLGARSNGTPRAGLTCDCSVLCNDGLACTRDRCVDGTCAHDTIAPAIPLPPSSSAACPGDTALFSVRASGQGALHYQWKKGATNVGADSATLALPVALADNGAQITCVVTDTCAAGTSAAATLTVFSSAASCSGGGSGLEAPNGASDPPAGSEAGRSRKDKNDKVAICHGTASGTNPYQGKGKRAEVEGQVQFDGAAGSGVYLFSGEFHLEATDLAIEGRGFDFEWSRKYRSREGRLTPMGQGWDFSYNRSVSVDTLGNLIVADGNSRRDTYAPNTSGCFTATGFFREVCPQVDGTFVLTFPNRTTWRFAALDGSAAQGKIVRVEDSNANAMTFAYDTGGRLITITDTLGRPISVSYNADGFVSAVTDFGGRQVTYGYASVLDPDGSPGDLRTVTSPSVTGTPTGNDFPAGKTTTYAYAKGMPQPALDHNLLSVTDPTGAVVVRNVYAPVFNPGSPRFDRLDRQVLPNGTVDFVYVAQTPTPADPAVTKTIVNDRAGNVSEAYFDAAHQVTKLVEYTGRAPNASLPTDDTTNRPTGKLRPTDPASFETRFEWNADSLPDVVTFPEGDTVACAYDSANTDARLRANLLQAVRSPGPRGGDQPVISESWSYATSFGDEPCPCKGCCGEGGGSLQLRKHKAQMGDLQSNPMYRWATYQNGLGHTYTQDVDPLTGNVLHLASPLVTTGVLGGGAQSIAESWDYNTFGQVTRHVDPVGRIDEFAYYAAGPQKGYLQSATVDAPGSIPGSHFALLTVTSRDAYGNLTSRTDPGGHTETFTYNQLDQLVRRVSSPPFNYRTDTYYDAADRVVGEDVRNVDENGAIEANDATSTLYYYDALSRLVRSRLEPDTVVIDTEYVYDANDHVTLERRGEAVNGHQPANVVRSLFDERDRLFRKTLAESDPLASTTQWDYDKNGNTIALRAGLEATPEVATFAYDGYDRPIGSTDPMGNVTTRHYDAGGNAVSVRVDGELIDGESGPNVRLGETTLVYDEIDRLVRADAAFFNPVTGSPIGDGFATTKTFYDAASRVVRAEDDNAHGASTSYDSAGRVAATTDAAGNTRTTSYDADSNVLAVTDSDVSDLGTVPQNFTTSYTYDSLNRRTSTTDPAGNEQHDLYDSRNNVRAHFDARGNQTQYAYDGANRLVATARRMTDTGDGSGALTFVLDGTRSHDDDSRLVSRTDDNGNTTSYVYDALDRLVATLYPDGTAETTSYDVHGNPSQVVDPNGSVTTATFDADDRLKTRSISRAAGVSGPVSETWKYDGLSRIVHAQNDGSVATRKHDSLSNVTQETLQIGAGPVRTLTASFDGAGNRVSMTYPSGVTVGRTYDLLDRAKTIATSGPRVCTGGPTPGIVCSSNPACGSGGVCQPPLATATATYDYAGSDRVIRRTCCGAPPNEQLDVIYDNDRRVSRTTHARLTPAGYVDSHSYGWDPAGNKTLRAQLIPSGTGVADAYAYDSASRLIHAVETPTSLPPVPIDYALDGVGNRTTVTGGTEAGAYTMSATLPEPADRQLNQYTSTPFDGAREYDRNGNLVSKSGTGETFSYDYRNRMVQVSGPGGTHTYAYDAFGRRILADGSQFFSDGEDTVQQLTVTGAFKSAYVYGDRIDDVVMGAQDVDGNGSPDRVAYHADDMGNVMAVTNGLGAVLESYDYDNYGKPRFFNPAGAPIAQSAIGNALLFNGHRYDAETGLYDYRTRHLDPRAGRFMSRDSIGTWGDEGNLGNGNAYVGNNPWSAVDPMGTSSDAYLSIEGEEPRRHVCPCPPYAPAGYVCYCVYGIDPGNGGGSGDGSRSTTERVLPVCVGGVCNGIRMGAPSSGVERPGSGLTSFGYAGGTHSSGGVGSLGGKGGLAAMKSGTVKFFNEAKGFGFIKAESKLCPGHPSCPPVVGSASASAGVGGAIGIGGGPEPQQRMVDFCVGDANVSPGKTCCFFSDVSGNFFGCCTYRATGDGDLITACSGPMYGNSPL